MVRAHGRYIRLSSFCSGLCMPEIAAMGAIEGFDNMVNDALYGILYRDINPVRGLIDQRVSRMINGYFGVVDQHRRGQLPAHRRRDRGGARR